MNPETIQKIIAFARNQNLHTLHLREIANLLDITSKKEVLTIRDFLLDKGLIIENTNGNGYRLTTFANEIIEKYGEWSEYLLALENEKVFNDNKEQLEFEKTKVDIELAKQTLKEFPRTKWFARISFIIAVILALKELYILLKP